MTMRFGLPDNALAVRDGLRDVLVSACSPAVIRAAGDADVCEPLWKALGSFGLPGLLASDARGGLGLDELAFVAAMEEAGWHGVPGPLVETTSYLPAVDLPVDGSVRLAVQQPRTSYVPYAGVATHVVRAADAAILERDLGPLVETVDRSRAMAAMPPAPKVVMVSVEQHDEFRTASARATLGTAAFLLGLARRQVDLTVGYVKDRQQFGVPVGSFQAVKHPLADAVVGTEFAWPAVLRAAYSLVTSDPDADLHVSMAKALASDASYRVSRVCLQAHGAIGYTVEYDLQLFMKRTWALANDWGTAAEHRAAVARALLERTAR